MRPKFTAIFWVVGVCALSIWLIAANGPTINANLLALLPQTERDPVVVNAVERVAKRFERHLAVLVGASDFATARTAADLVADRLKKSGRFRRVQFDDYQDLVRRAVAFYLPQRFHLLGNVARDQLTAGGAAAFEKDVLKRYYTPRTTISSQLIDKDPLLLLPGFLEERARATEGRPEIRDGYLTVRADDRIYIVLLGELSDSPFSIQVQRELMPILDDLRTNLPERINGTDLLIAGVLPHAAAGTKSGLDEMSTVGLGSVLAIIVLLVAMFRSPWPFVLTMTAIGLGCASGLAACLAIFGEVHLLTLVFGASLVGISVDYSFHFFCERFRHSETWSPVAGIRHIFPGITLGLVTSVIGFTGLFFAPFPGMQGMAVFSSVGLSVAYGCVVLCYPLLTRRLPRPRFDRQLNWMRVYGALWGRTWRWPAYVAAASLTLAAVIGCLRLTSSDDVRLLQTPDTRVMTEELRTRTLIGRNLASQFILVEGRDESDFLHREEALTAKLRALRSAGKLVGYLAISDFLASPQRHRENRAMLTPLITGKQNVFDRIAQRIGIPESTRDTYIAEFRRAGGAPPASIAQWLAHPVSEPYRHLWLGSSGRGVVGVVGLRGVYDLSALRALADTDPRLHFVDPAGDVSDLFGQYRRQTVWLTLISYAVVMIVLMVRYGVTGGILVIAPPALAALASLGVLGFVGEPISLFHIMALLLVLGIGVDYALFFRETGVDSPATLLAIALSCLTTLLAFGLLAFSATTAIHAFGQTVLVGILVAFLLSPMAGWKRGTQTATAARRTP